MKTEINPNIFKEGDREIMLETDVVIIGGGAVGCAIARELSKYELDITLVEKNEDVGGKASKSNSAIIHTGYDATPGSLESQLVVAANPMYESLCKDLDVSMKIVGAILPAMDDEQYQQLAGIKEKAFKNRVYDVEYLNRQQIMEMEANINPQVKGGLYIPREGVIDPFTLVQAYGENAYANGVKFLLNNEVMDIEVDNNRVKRVVTDKKTIATKYVINAAALYCDHIASMVGKDDYKVIARRGEFYILDKSTSCKVNHIVLPIPTKITKGKLICPTIHGNTLIGPTAEDMDIKTDSSTTREGLDSILEDVLKLIPGVNIKDTITQYSGLRPYRIPEGYNIDVYEDLKGYINISGVRSTGLTASISIGKYVAHLMKENGMDAPLKDNFIAKRKGIIKFNEISRQDQEEAIKKNPLYGNIVCRCETITEGEILDAIHRPLGAKSVDMVKRRVRAGTGRCQGGFCGPKVIEILERELNLSEEEITKKGYGSQMLAGKVR